MRLFKMVDLKEGELVQFVGVYVTRWQSEWGEPTVGFVEADVEDVDYAKVLTATAANQDLRHLTL